MNSTLTLEAPAKPISPWWHTGLLAGAFLWMAVSGALLRSEGGLELQNLRAIPVYCSMIGMQWTLLLAVWLGGLRRTGTPLADVVRGSWSSGRKLLRDLGLAAAIWLGMALIRLLFSRLLGGGGASQVDVLLPRSGEEILFWVVVSVSAGFCEETIFRGYFQRQFEAWTGSTWAALVMQALLFGISHGYQGVQACAKITAIGVLLGVFAMWRRSLRPGIVAHATSDILGGLGL